MRAFFGGIAIAVCLVLSVISSRAAGTVPLALTQQSDVNGKPLAGCFLYIYQAGTVATFQNSFQDFGLTIPNPNPLKCDQAGRIPMFWLADGLIHVRLTDASGVVQLDYPSLQVLGPSSGGGGGGGSVDPTTIAATGDVKFRPTSETLTGWVKMNGLTIGSAISGASGRANADTQNLFVYLWANCTNAHCPVSGGRGVSALADFSANKTMTLLDWRDRTPVGLDDMGNSAAGGLLSSNITSGGGDGPTTPAAFGGVANGSIAQANLPNVAFPVTDPGHTHGLSPSNSFLVPSGGSSGFIAGSTTFASITVQSAMTGISVRSGGSGTPMGTIGPFMLGTWYMKL